MLKPVEKIPLRPPIPPPCVDIFFGRHLLQSDLLRKTCCDFAGRIAIIADSAIAASYGRALQKSIDGELLIFEAGDRGKTRQAKQELEDILLQRKFGRDTLCIALGGGVTTDLTAFLASTYMRGVPLILIPTTLLAMVDAAIGGKTGVDTPFGKNLIGSFYHPKAIFIDPSLLASLPDAEWVSGLAEILKYGLIADPSIWESLEKSGSRWKQEIDSLILSSIRVKKAVIEEDPCEEKGIRRIVNFGHTVAHALEHLSQYSTSHGEAVAIGCIAESWLSWRTGHLPWEDLQRIERLFRSFPFPLKLPQPFSADLFLESMRLDKKSKKQEARFVMIDRIGRVVPFDGEYCQAVCCKDLDDLVEWIERFGASS